jgi:nucleotide-binding universal stress UspA family protein
MTIVAISRELGSLAEKVVRQASGPVLTGRPKEYDFFVP